MEIAISHSRNTRSDKIGGLGNSTLLADYVFDLFLNIHLHTCFAKKSNTYSQNV